MMPYGSALPSTRFAPINREGAQGNTTHTNQPHQFYTQGPQNQLGIPPYTSTITETRGFASSGNGMSDGYSRAPIQGFSPLTHRNIPGSYQNFQPSQRELFLDLSQQQQGWK